MKRWLDTPLSDDLRRVLRSSAQDARPAAIARLEKRLTRTLGGVASGASMRPEALSTPSVAPSVAPAASGVSLSSTALGAKLVLGLATVGALGALTVHTSAPDPSAQFGAARAVPVVIAPVVIAPGNVPAAEPAAAQLAPAAAPAALVEPVQAPHAVPAPALEPHADRSRPHAAVSQLSDEVRQLDVIRKYLRVDTARALAAADAHERRFPNGKLGAERELLRIEALFRLGREREARSRAAALVASPTADAYRRQVQRLIARYAHAPDS